MNKRNVHCNVQYGIGSSAFCSATAAMIFLVVPCLCFPDALLSDALYLDKLNDIFSQNSQNCEQRNNEGDSHLALNVFWLWLLEARKILKCADLLRFYAIFRVISANWTQNLDEICV